MRIHLPKISIHLATFEVIYLRRCIALLVVKGLENLKKAEIDVIVLIEFYNQVENLHLKTEYMVQPKKGFRFSMPLSIARILHDRLQSFPYSAELVIILGKIDYALKRVNMAQEKEKTLNI